MYKNIPLFVAVQVSLQALKDLFFDKQHMSAPEKKI
jgi:hypothetical protein